MASPLQDPPLAGPQGKDVAWAAQVRGTTAGMDGHLDCSGPILSRNARTNSVFRASINADCEGGLVAVCIAIHHQWQIESIQALTLHRQADQAPSFSGHEVDLLGGCELGRTDQVAFVLAIFIVHDHDRFAIADGRQSIGDCIETNGRNSEILGLSAGGGVLGPFSWSKGQLG